MITGQSKADHTAALLSQGRYDLMVEEYRFPLTLYLPDQPAAFITRETAWGFFQSFHAALVAQGMVRLTARVTAETLPTLSRSRLWTDWYGEGPRVAPTLVARTVCYLRNDGERELTEMVEFTDLALPALMAA